jgi:multidrug efflux pump
MTLSVAIAISLVVLLTTTPMMCAYLLPDRREALHGRIYRIGERAFEAVLGLYDYTLRQALQWPALVMLSLFATLGFSVYLFEIEPKGFVPQQDNGLMFGIQADQSISFQAMQQKLIQFLDILRRDLAIETVSGFTVGVQTNSGFVFVVLKPLSERNVSINEVMRRLRPKLNEVVGARSILIQ